MQTVRTNLDNIASSQYTNFHFTSMCVFNGVVIGAGPGGLFKACCGDSDNGTPIDAYFITPTTNFGEINKKGFEYLNFLGEADGNVAFELTGDDEITAGPYEAVVNLSKSQQRVRVKIGKGFKCFYGKLKMSNVDGSYFAVDGIQVVASVAKRGIK